jgi:glycosyltransferase involved in cell wall biosynthesis
LLSVLEETPVRRIIIIDAGSIDGTLKIASSIGKVRVYVRSDLNMGQAIKYGFTVADTELVVSLDSDIILRICMNLHQNSQLILERLISISDNRVENCMSTD